jgi:ribonuclease D
MQIITTTDALEALCRKFSADEFITVDTEFMREHTFWPILCLIQVAGESEEAIIDPMARRPRSCCVL